MTRVHPTMEGIRADKLTFYIASLQIIIIIINYRKKYSDVLGGKLTHTHFLNLHTGH